MDIFTDRIEPLFNNSGLSDVELENAIGLPRSSIYKWRTGKSQSYKNYIAQIAKYFDIPVNVFMEDGTQANNKNESLIRHAQQLSNQMVVASQYLRDLFERRNVLFREKAEIDEKAQNIIQLLRETKDLDQEAMIVRTLRNLSLSQENCQHELDSLEEKLNSFAEENAQLYIFIMISELSKQDQKKVYNYVNNLFMNKIKDIADQAKAENHKK